MQRSYLTVSNLTLPSMCLDLYLASYPTYRITTCHVISVSVAVIAYRSGLWHHRIGHLQSYAADAACSRRSVTSLVRLDPQIRQHDDRLISFVQFLCISTASPGTCHASDHSPSLCQPM